MSFRKELDLIEARLNGFKQDGTVLEQQTAKAA
jgi:hypothetical protein